MEQLLLDKGFPKETVEVQQDTLSIRNTKNKTV
jgi:hypothetical protein